MPANGKGLSGREAFLDSVVAIAEKNARLIDAGPELLEALIEQVNSCLAPNCRICARHEVIIRKVLGQAA